MQRRLAATAAIQTGCLALGDGLVAAVCLVFLPQARVLGWVLLAVAVLFLVACGWLVGRWSALGRPPAVGVAEGTAESDASVGAVDGDR